MWPLLVLRNSTAAGRAALSAAEIGQIAAAPDATWQAGTFGTTADEGLLDQTIVNAVEEHRFEPLTRIAWRNTNLRFGSWGCCCKASMSAARSRARANARRRRPSRAAAAVAQCRGERPNDQSRCRALLMGGVSDPDFRQGDERQPCTVPGALLPGISRAPANAYRSPG